jgi:hypothetical protein
MKHETPSSNLANASSSVLDSGSKSKAFHTPRWNVSELRPGEVLMADNKSYATPQRSAVKHAFVLVDVATNAKFKIDIVSKTENGKAFRRIAILNGWHKLPYKCTLYTDGCGSMKHAEQAAIAIGIDHVYIPPHEQSLNEAEKICDRMWAAARTIITRSSAQGSNNLDGLFALAVEYAMHVDLRMATTSSRGYITPIEGLTGQRPDISGLVPFYTKAFVCVPKQKRNALAKQGSYNARAETGRFMGFASPFSTTAKVLLDGNRMVTTMNVTYDSTDYSEGPPAPVLEAAVPIEGANLDEIEVIPTIAKAITAAGTTGNSGTTENSGFGTPENPGPDSVEPNEYQYSTDGAMSPEVVGKPASLSTPPSEWPTPEVEIEHLSPEIGIAVGEIGPRDRFKPDFYVPHTTKAEEPRQVFLHTIEVLSNEDETELNSRQLEGAISTLKADAPKDHGTINEACHVFAVQAQKDMNWKKALASDQHPEAIKALNKELTSLQKTILTEITDAHPEWFTAKQKAVPGRILLDIKRSGEYKARGVKQGFKEDKETADGPDFSYYSHVAKLLSIRVALLRARRGSRNVRIKDVRTAYLQAHKYPPGIVKYTCFRMPDTGKWRYFRQSGPIYGEASAAVRWEDTIAPWLEEMGFERGKNDKCVFYHPTRDLIVILYVDDCLIDGATEDADWICDELDKRFDCKDTEHLEPGTTLDYLGFEVSLTDTHLHIGIRDYIQNCLIKLHQEDSKPADTPISSEIDTDSGDLDFTQKRTFLTALGMLGWIANVRPDVAYAHSRIGQHAAAPSQSALKTVIRAFRYLKGTMDLAITIPLRESVDLSTHRIGSSHHQSAANDWEFYCDTDHAGNSEDQNKRRSQNGVIALCNGAPVLWASKVSSVAFAHPDIGEAHADVSSAAAEIYGAANATFELLHLSYIADEMGMDFPKPIVLQMDNEAARCFVANSVTKSRLKHIDCRQEWVQVLRNKNILKTQHIDSHLNLAVIFTKILPKDTFQGIVARLLSQRHTEARIIFRLIPAQLRGRFPVNQLSLLQSKHI